MDIKLFDSELKVMDILWKDGDTTAKKISDILKEQVGWNVNTTYTLIKRCIAKGAIERNEPNFICHALIPKERVQEQGDDRADQQGLRRLGGFTFRLSSEPKESVGGGNRAAQADREQAGLRRWKWTFFR